MSPELVSRYVARAVDFFDGMTLMRSDPLFRQSSALLAIHSATSFADALRTGLGDEKLALEDHGSTVSALQRLLASTKLTQHGGLRHLGFLLSRKIVVAYGGKRLEHTDYEALITKAEQFAQWARNTASQLNIEGWKYDS